MLRTALNKINDKTETIIQNDDESLLKGATKAFGLGLLEGVIDVTFVIGAATLLFVGGVFATSKFHKD